MVITKEEFATLKSYIEMSLSNEGRMEKPPEDLIPNTITVGKIFIETGLADELHTAYHGLKGMYPCESAILSLVVKVFIVGYEGRKAVEENAQLDSILNSSVTASEL